MPGTLAICYQQGAREAMSSNTWYLGLAALGVVLIAGAFSMWSQAEEASPAADLTKKTTQTTDKEMEEGLALATFGSGCFWCTEAVFQELVGVKTVTSGYCGGDVANPSYQAVTTGTTGHAEVIQLTYDPKQVDFPTLLEVFWKTHDPTTLNRQGADVGTQYRSVIFYHDNEQRKLAEEYKAKLDAAGAFDKPIVTEITEYSEFFAAEDYHQDFYSLNENHPYCAAVVGPKVAKFRQVFSDKLKNSAEN